MRLLPILAAATIGVFAVTAVNAQGTSQARAAGRGQSVRRAEHGHLEQGQPEHVVGRPDHRHELQGRDEEKEQKESDVIPAPESKTPPAHARAVFCLKAVRAYGCTHMNEPAFLVHSGPRFG